MKTPLTITRLFILFAALAATIRAADIPEFNIYLSAQVTKDPIPLVFDVTETATGYGDDSHTKYIIKAIVIESRLDVLKPGMEFVGCFDRVYSFLDTPNIPSFPESHPFKVGDRITIGVTSTNSFGIDAFLLKKESAQQPPPVTTSRADNNQRAKTVELPWSEASRQTGVSREELASIATSAEQAHNLVTVFMTRDDRDKNTIRVNLGESQTAKGGLSFFYKKTAAGWVEEKGVFSTWTIRPIEPNWPKIHRQHW